MKSISEARRLSEPEKTVADYLHGICIKYNVESAGKGLIRDGWECDGWRVTFRNGQNYKETFDYYTGIGHRALPDSTISYLKKAKLSSVYARDIIDRDAVPIAPCAAMVLYCLILDSSANDQSFTDWCDSFGYDSDSIKALNMYTECCTNASRLHKVFTSEQIDSLRTMLENY